MLIDGGKAKMKMYFCLLITFIFTVILIAFHPNHCEVVNRYEIKNGANV